MARPVRAIAMEVVDLWGDKIYFGAKPYLIAMLTMDAPTDAYGLDSGPSVIRYFLANAQSFRGERARAIKAELKGMVKGIY